MKIPMILQILQLRIMDIEVRKFSFVYCFSKETWYPIALYNFGFPKFLEHARDFFYVLGKMAMNIKVVANTKDKMENVFKHRNFFNVNIGMVDWHSNKLVRIVNFFRTYV